MRLAAGIVASLYIAVAWYAMGAESAFKVLIFLVFPLTLIWFSQPMGSYGGRAGHGVVTSDSPAWMVAIGGWVLLLLPLMFWLIWMFGRSP
jgi:hypothetical protein